MRLGEPPAAPFLVARWSSVQMPNYPSVAPRIGESRNRTVRKKLLGQALSPNDHAEPRSYEGSGAVEGVVPEETRQLSGCFFISFVLAGLQRGGYVGDRGRIFPGASI